VAPVEAETSDTTPEEALPSEPDGEDLEDPLSPYRTRFDVLAERAIGTASKPVAFNWRRTHLHLAPMGSLLFELNNFNSLRGGGMARFPGQRTIVELGFCYTRVWDTPSSRTLALTPYRQPGRPSRLELDVTVALPLAEGVVTTFPRFFPAVQLVFNAYVGFRYILYPAGFPGMQPGQVAGAIFSPTITPIEIDNLDDQRLDAMQVDPGRYGLMLGFGDDIYFEQGIFVSPRIMLAVPILSPATQTELLTWADFSLAIGMAF